MKPAVSSKVAEWRSGKGVGFRTKGSLVRIPAGAHFVVALSKSRLPCLVLVEPRKRWTDDRLWTDCDKAEDYVVPNVLSPRDLVFRPDNMDETVPHQYANGSSATRSVHPCAVWANSGSSFVLLVRVYLSIV